MLPKPKATTIDVANVQNVLHNLWKERVLLRSFQYYFWANVSERKFCHLSSFITNSFGLNYKVCNLLIFFCNLFFFLWHMKSYTTCLVSCTRILIGSWYMVHTWIVFNVSLYNNRLHVLLHVLLRSLLFLKRTRSLTFFIPVSHVHYIYESHHAHPHPGDVWVSNLVSYTLPHTFYTQNLPATIFHSYNLNISFAQLPINLTLTAQSCTNHLNLTGLSSHHFSHNWIPKRLQFHTELSGPQWHSTHPSYNQLPYLLQTISILTIYLKEITQVLQCHIIHYKISLKKLLFRHSRSATQAEVPHNLYF